MMDLCTSLEPYVEAKKVEIITELQEFNQIIFIQQGKVLVGFDINNERKYCIQFNDKCVIGAYGITWNQRAQFNYITGSPVKGFFIRKEKWVKILTDN